MKIYGPYTRKDGRKHVILYDPNVGLRKTVSYPKYLMEQHIGRPLEKWETVDHIDEDFTNDNLDNLQILSRKNNIQKSLINGTFFKCSNNNCDVQVWRCKAHVAKLKIGVFCSNSCRSKTFGNQYQIKERIVQLAGDN